MKWGWRHRENLVDGEWRWSFARRQLIYDVVEPERVYLERWRFDTPFVSIFLHSINLPDRDPYPHTHPFSWSRSLIVKGSYVEERGPYGDEVRKYRPGQVNRIDADTGQVPAQLAELLSLPLLTLHSQTCLPLPVRLS